jgi:uncharacterized HAD superfamily protein
MVGEFKKVKRISCDIDGVLNYYPVPWVEYINLQTHSSFVDKEIARKELGEVTYNKIKWEYRHSDFKKNLPVNPHFVHFLRSLQEQNVEILISTSRPIESEEYPYLRNLTETWLKNNQIPHHKLYFKEETPSFIETLGSIDFHLDDEFKYCNYFQQHGIVSYLYQKNLETPYKEGLIHYIGSVEHIQI